MWRTLGRVICVSSLLASAACSSSSGASSEQRPPERKVVDFALMREDLLNASGMPDGSLSFVYSTSLNLERTDSIGHASDYSTFEYDPSGAMVILEKRYGVNDTLATAIEYQYTDGVLSESVTYDGDGVMLSFETYVFANGKKTSATLHADQLHELTFSYDAAGKRTGSVDKVGGAVTASSTWHYASDGAPTSVEVFAADGTTLSGSRNLTTVASGSNYDYFAFWDL